MLCTLIFQAAMCVLGSGAGAAVYYLDTGSSSRDLWLMGSGLFFTVFPYTVAVMMPDIKQNLKDDVFETKGN